MNQEHHEERDNPRPDRPATYRSEPFDGRAKSDPRDAAETRDQNEGGYGWGV